jgi:signal transduction histidine kinase
VSRLYLRVYIAIVGAIVGTLTVFAVIATMLWHRTGGAVELATDSFAQLIHNALPPAGTDSAIQQAAVERLTVGIDADVSVLAPDGSRLAVVGRPLQLPDDIGHRISWLDAHYRVSRRGPRLREAAWAHRLPDGRWLLVSEPIDAWHPFALLIMLIVLAVAVGVAALPIARRLTQRLERLQAGVESLGSGDLSARVPVEGRDEVAQLARSFNAAAARIEELMGAHRTLLANASHDLRTPLARIRMAIELMKESADPQRRAGLEQDICELDQLIDEILLASRLDTLTLLDSCEEVDLLALAAEECSRHDATHLEGTSTVIYGDARLLRRLIRNLLDNATRHGAPPTQVRVASASDHAKLTIWDGGDGIPANEFERVFEPFYRSSGDRDTTGVGLGLALVRQIARRHGGDARCMATPESPSCFVVTLPANIRLSSLESFA